MLTSPASFVGRQVELNELGGLVAEVAGGRGGAFWLEGEPGIGKTSLVDAALSVALDGRTRVFRAAGEDLLQLFALHLIADALRTREDVDEDRIELAELLAGRRVGAVDSVSVASERILALIDRECARSPVVLVLDDVQWADAATLAVGRRLVQVVEQIPLLLVLVSRPVPRRPEADALRDSIGRWRPGAVVDLVGLGSDDVMAIAVRSLSAQVGPRLREALAAAAGNPLYVRETVDVLRRDGLLRIEDGVAELTVTADPGSSSLGAIIRRGLAGLSEATRTALPNASVLIGRFGRSDFATVSGLAGPDLDLVLDEAVTAHILIEAESRWSFRHPVIRQTLYEELPSAVRIGLHAHMARSLKASGAAWDQVAQHLLVGGPGLDGSMMDWLAEVSPLALASMPAVAADLLERGRNSAASDDPRRALFTTRLTTALRMLHRQEALLTLGETALRTVDDPQLLGEVAWNLAQGLGMAARLPDLQAVVTQILAGPETPPWSARLRALLVPVLGYAGLVDESERQAELAIAEGERHGDPVAAGWALHFRSLAAANNQQQLGVVDRALALVRDDDPESVNVRLLLYGNRVWALSRMHRRDEVEALLPTVSALADSAGGYRVDQTWLVRAQHHMLFGQWEDALLYLEQVTEVTDNLLRLGVHGMSAEIAARRYDHATAMRHLSRLKSVAYHDGPHRLWATRALHAEMVIAEAEGRPDDALAIMAGWLDPQYAKRSIWRQEELPDLVRLALAIGDRATAEAAAALAEADKLASAGSPEMVDAAICRAMVDDDPERLLSVGDYLARVGKRTACAFVWQEAAVRLAQRGDVSQAKSAFTRAVAVYDALGAVWDLRQIEARLRPFGLRRGLRSPQRRTDTGWDALTAAERDVAHWVTMGESNPEIARRLLLSRRTVETHVRHILAKLNGQSRLDIARAGAQYARSD